ncbi:MAG TPA: hypothetical protein VFA33_01075 [Bryobacteraceae bacterium]|nr:hypothetical protein [Bryobacteraceae bacterium]
MTLLEEIQNAAIDAGSDLGTLLRKCKLLAARLDSQPLEEWLLWESNGYPDEVPLPSYRVWPMDLKGDFAGPFGSGLRNMPIPLATIPEEARTTFEEYRCRESVANVEATLKRSKRGTLQVPTGDLALLLGTGVYQRQNCIQAWGEFGVGNLAELLNSVRNRILDFALAVWKAQPQAGEAGNQVPKMEPSRVTQIFHTTVYGGSTNVVGTATASHMAFTVGASDFSSLRRALRENHVSEDDIAELQDAVESEKTPARPESYGPKVSSWIAKMFKKASDGTWTIGITAAGQILPKLIAKYYGFQ